MKTKRIASLIGMAWLLGTQAPATSLQAIDASLSAQILSQTLPETCDSAYPEVGNFVQFYESSLYVIAARSGAQAKGVADLFAVLEMRNRMTSEFPNLGDESPLDRLVIAQLCHFQAYQKQQSGGGLRAPPISSGDPALHKHLLGIASKLYKDSRKLMVDALAARARLRHQREDLEGKVSQIKEARQLGRAKVRDLLED